MTQTTLVLVVTFAALFVSSVAGYGGSLILVPALASILGPRQGIAFAALLLGWNNVFKVLAYRHSLALRQGWPLVLATAVGVTFGARLAIAAPERLVIWTIAGASVATLLIEVLSRAAATDAGASPGLRSRRSIAVPAIAASAVLSGVSGTSGPLKGIAIRAMRLPRLHHVGLAASVSLVADAVKIELFADAGYLADLNTAVLLGALPMMPVGAWTGRAINRRINERQFRWVFWTVVGGYNLRMLGAWF